MPASQKYPRAMILQAINFVCCMLICTLFSSCSRVQPIPKDKLAFVGKWNSEVGISIEILAKGTANIVRLSPKSGAEKLDIGAAHPTNFRVYFEDNDRLNLVQPFNIGRIYKIDKYPNRTDDQMVMILNGIKLTKE